MAVGAGPAATPNGIAVTTTSTTNTPLELAIDLPHSPGTRLNLHLTLLANSLMLFLTSTSPDSGTSPSPMGSFVFAMPDRYHPSQPMSTTIYSVASSLDFTTRMAKVLVRRLGMPCYVGSSIDLAGGLAGGSVDEEVEAFRAVVSVVAAEGAKIKGGV